MARNRCYASGFTAQLRVTYRVSPLGIPSLMTVVDSAFRRSASLRSFAVLAQEVAERRELVFTVAGLRHESTDRADSTVLYLLRRIAPFAERRKWVAIPKEHWGYEGGTVYIDYAIVPNDEAEAQLRTLQEAAGVKGSMLSTTSLPPPSS